MVGRELPTPLCPHGEDHPGLSQAMLPLLRIAGAMVRGGPVRDSSGNWVTTVMKMMDKV